MTPNPKGEELLRTHEVAELLGVSERAVRSWADSGKMTCYRTLGGHRQFPANEVKKVLIQVRGKKGAVDFAKRLERIRKAAHRV